jgi:hypothetical protein
MSALPDDNNLEPLKRKAEDFLRSTSDLTLVEEGTKLLDLAHYHWQITFQFGKLLLEVWNSEHSYAWRIEAIVHQDSHRMRLIAHKPGGRGPSALEIETSQGSKPASKTQTRSLLRQSLLSFLQKQFSGWKFEQIGNRSDREFSFSAWYTRGLARRGRIAWAFIGLDPAESSAAADAVLAYGLNWLDWLRERHSTRVISGLKLFLPPSATLLTAHRAAYLNPALAQIEIFTWSPEEERLHPVDLRDFGNVETRLIPRHHAKLWLERHRSFLVHLLGHALNRMDLVPDASGAALSLRILGLEIGRLEGQTLPRFYWGLEGNRKEYREEERQAFRQFLDRALSLRCAGSPDPASELYRSQPERWLESVLVRDLSQIDPALQVEEVYPQVPAFSGGDRGVVDILSVLRNGRLAVIELKLHEEITLPLQGLDYWLRVKWLNDRGQFQKFGYFPGIDLSTASPVLYLVSPAFRFHSTSQKIVRYLSPSIEVFQVGINQQWRSKVKVLFRRRLHPSAETSERSRESG